jgi:hypothetical protein
MPAFEPRSDPTSTSARWTRWLERFNTYILAADIKDDARKRALLLYRVGPEVHEIFKTLEEGETKDFKSAVKALTEYFEPEKNVIYRTYMFLDKRRKAKRNQSTNFVRVYEAWQNTANLQTYILKLRCRLLQTALLQDYERKHYKTQNI